MRDTDHRVVLLITTVSVFMTAFMGSSTNIALPTIGREFAMDAVLLSWVAMAYTLANAMSLLPVGRLADILGRRRIFTTGVSGYVAASLAVGLASSGTMLIAARFVQGIFASMMFATSTAILTSVFPANERGRVLGINTAAVYTGLSVGPFLGGVMTQALGWRSIFLAGAALGLLSIALVVTRMKGEWAAARGEGFDGRGALVYAAAIVSFMYGLSLLPKPEGAGLIVVGLALGIGFVRWEGRAAQPLFNLDLFRRNRGFALSNLAALINYSATAAVGFLLSLYLQYIKARTPQEAGLVLIAQPIVQAVFSPLTGRLSDRIESRIVSSAGMAVTATGLALLTFLGEATPFWYIVLCLILLGFGFALFSSPNTNAVMSSVTRRWYGVASATVATMRTMGMMLSLGIAALIFALVIGRVQITPQQYPAFLASARLAFSIFAVACFAGVFASLARGKIHGNQESGDRGQERGGVPNARH